MSDLPFKPLILIGAPRSGTNALRNALTEFDEIATWPCDEINPIWRHGNLDWPNDALPASRATPKVKKFIRNAFVRIWRQSGRPEVILEKTCANTLRVDFVREIFPEAMFIHLVRDGQDVVPSALKRWQGKLEVKPLPYFAAKARYVPIRDLPHHGFSFVAKRLSLLARREEKLKSWGPVYPGMREESREDLELLCAKQWSACINAATDALCNMDNAPHFLKYEALTQDAAQNLAAILNFCGVHASDDQITGAATGIRKPSREGPPLSAHVLDQCRSSLEQHGYAIR